MGGNNTARNDSSKNLNLACSIKLLFFICNILGTLNGSTLQYLAQTSCQVLVLGTLVGAASLLVLLGVLGRAALLALGTVQ